MKFGLTTPYIGGKQILGTSRLVVNQHPDNRSRLHSVGTLLVTCVL